MKRKRENLMIKRSLISIVIISIFCSFAGADVISDFDDLSLADDSHWSGNYPSDETWGTYGTDYFQSGNASYENHSDGDLYAWADFAYSNEIDTQTEGYTNQLCRNCPCRQ
jgi:hypothetical protein